MTHPLAALIAGAVARGWTHDANAHKEMDADLAQAVTTEVLAALEAATPPDLVEAGKVLEGVTPGKWEPHHHDDYSELAVYHPEFTGLGHFYEAADARFIAWCREGVPALIALATAQAAQIAGLEEAVDANWITHQRVVAAEAKVAGLEAQIAAEKEENRWAYIQAALDDNKADAEAEAATLRAEVERLRGALEAFKDFDDLPTMAKRPDVFELRVRQPILRALEEEGRDG